MSSVDVIDLIDDDDDNDVDCDVEWIETPNAASSEPPPLIAAADAAAASADTTSSPDHRPLTFLPPSTNGGIITPPPSSATDATARRTVPAARKPRKRTAAAPPTHADTSAAVTARPAKKRAKKTNTATTATAPSAPPVDVSQLRAPLSDFAAIFPHIVALFKLYRLRDITVTFRTLQPHCANIARSRGIDFSFEMFRRLFYLANDQFLLKPIRPTTEIDVYDPTLKDERRNVIDLYEICDCKSMAARKYKPSTADVDKAVTKYTRRCIAFQSTFADNEPILVPECDLPPLNHVDVDANDRVYSKMDDALTIPMTDYERVSLAAYRQSLRADGLSFPDQPQEEADAAEEKVDMVDTMEMKEAEVEAVTVEEPSVVQVKVKSEKVEKAEKKEESAVDVDSGAAAAPILDSSDDVASVSRLHQFLAHLRAQKWYDGQIVYVHTTPPQRAVFIPITSQQQQQQRTAPVSYSNTPTVPPLAPPVVSALRSLGYTSLYSHQAEAVTAIMNGHHTMIATNTSSGKSLAFIIPILHTLVTNPHARALLIYPTKALAQDQLRSLRNILVVLGDPTINADTIDGDTPQIYRTTIRNTCRIILTNPDFLHITLLPRHAVHVDILKHIQFVVIDETHVYRGAFGSHVALILRRFQRICSFYQSKPLFIMCSATIANPLQLGEQLIGQNVKLIDKDGSTHASKLFVLYNPPRLKSSEGQQPGRRRRRPTAGPAEDTTALGQHTTMSTSSAHYARVPFQYESAIAKAAESKRRSSHAQTALLVANCVQRSISALCFAKARRSCEVVASMCLDILKASESTAPLADLVTAYRSGYRIKHRRDIERRLFAGQLRAVVATNALELGIDVGTLDCTVHLGFPSSIASLKQQSGRAGRGSRAGMSLLVAFDSPLDQYFMSHPEHLFDKPIERALIDPNNVELLTVHLLCAASELPLIDRLDASFFGQHYHQCRKELAEKNWIVDANTMENRIQRASDRVVAARNGRAQTFAEWDRGDENECKWALTPAGDWSVALREERNGGKTMSDASADRMKVAFSWVNPVNKAAPHGSVKEHKSVQSLISIRTIGGKTYLVIDSGNNKHIDSLDESKAFWELYVGAILLHNGQDYLVERMERFAHIAHVKRVKVNYFTKARDVTRVNIQSKIRYAAATNYNEKFAQNNAALSTQGNRASLSLDQLLRTIKAELNEHDEYEQSHTATTTLQPLAHYTYFGRIKVNVSILGYRRINKMSQAVIDYISQPLSPMERETYACWMVVPYSITLALNEYNQSLESIVDDPTDRTDLRNEPLNMHAGLHALAHCMIQLIPLHIMCESEAELGTECSNVYELAYDATHARAIRLLFYEYQPGLMWARECVGLLVPLLKNALDVLRSCPCSELQGCPCCCQSANCRELNLVMDKRSAIFIAEHLLDLDERANAAEDLPLQSTHRVNV